MVQPVMGGFVPLAGIAPWPPFGPALPSAPACDVVLGTQVGLNGGAIGSCVVVWLVHHLVVSNPALKGLWDDQADSPKIAPKESWLRTGSQERARTTRPLVLAR